MNTPNLDYEKNNISLDIASNEDVCYINNSGIHRLSWKGSLVQDVVTGNSYVFSSYPFHSTKLLALDDGNYLLVANDDEYISKIYRFEFDENASLDIVNTLTIWALEETHVLRAAISAFSKNNPNTFVKVEYGRGADSSGATDEDIIRTLNIRLLAGKAPDILILDGLPASRYIEQGILTDISEKIDVSGCYENIMQTFEKDGKAYAYPALFQMPVFIASDGDKHAGGINGLEELAKLAGEENALYYGSYIEMFESLYIAYSSTIFPDASSVEENALRSFLKYTKIISNELGLTSENTYIHGGVGIVI